MKTKELIRQLQEADPSGELEVGIHNEDILSIEHLPAYYDGSLQVINKNEKGHIVSGEIYRTGSKIKICTYPLEDAVLDCMVSHYDQHGNTDYEFPITVHGDCFNSYADTIKHWHDEARKIILSVRTNNKEDI